MLENAKVSLSCFSDLCAGKYIHIGESHKGIDNKNINVQLSSCITLYLLHYKNDK